MFHHLITFLHHQNLHEGFSGEKEAAEFRRAVFSIFTESSIKLTKRLISKFENLIHKEEREEEYQSFLSRHPVFLDPLSRSVIDKQDLGSDFETDFVIRRLDDAYIVVEIEKPQDRIFTKSDDFTADFTHAFGQVIDFQQWVEQNISYARNEMPKISSPKGILIMGQRKSLSERQKSKLKRYSKNSRSVEILTYDDVLSRSINLYSNIHKESVFGGVET